MLSAVNTADPGPAGARPGPTALPGGPLARPTQPATPSSPTPTPGCAALAERITAGARHHRYAKVAALEAWIGRPHPLHDRHPAAAPGQDTVTEFLFGNRSGFCEQISTALAVMLRTPRHPGPRGHGYVPGPYNPITDLYEVQAKDAHAWVQVWFPGYGWQSFDPTAVVPLANPSPARAIAHDARRTPCTASRACPSPSSLARSRRSSLLVVAPAPAGRRPGPGGRRRRSSAAAASRPGWPRPGETACHGGAAASTPWRPAGRVPSAPAALAGAAEAGAYGGREPDRPPQRELVGRRRATCGAARRRSLRRRRPRRSAVDGQAPAPRRTSPGPSRGRKAISWRGRLTPSDGREAAVAAVEGDEAPVVRRAPSTTTTSSSGRDGRAPGSQPYWSDQK